MMLNIAGLNRAVASEPVAANPATVAPFTAQYDLFRDEDNVGQATISLTALPDNRWQYQTASEARLYFFHFSDREQSQFRWLNGKPQPLQFEKESKRPGKAEVTRQQFDWQQLLDSGTRGKKSWSTALTPGTQDLQSHLLALQQDLAAGIRDVHYAVSKNGRVRDYHYAVTKEETLDTALGRLAVLRVERIREPGDDRQTISWFAPSLNYIPVRLQQFEDGELQGDMQIRALQR
ncbi:DUF3108 domain-containing protein [Permianibacter sp. IMCC34836]|nr:DUF3108 domain-containing protein [Permianibacter fluminis]